MTEDPSIKGDKLRDAIFIVWLANKFDRDIQTADLRRLSGYAGSGMYGGKESGWFTENEKGSLGLTEKGELYLRTKLLGSHDIVRGLFLYVALTFLMMLIQNYLYYEYNYTLIYKRTTLALASTTFILFYLVWYRFNWFFIKRKTIQ